MHVLIVRNFIYSIKYTKYTTQLIVVFFIPHTLVNKGMREDFYKYHSKCGYHRCCGAAGC